MQPLSPTSRSGTTHAGGINPSMSFFRPSKPTQQQQYSRPSSASSSNANDVYPLASIKRHSASSEDQSGSIDHTHFNTLKSAKQSREPLLPIGERPTPHASRPSIARERSSVSGANPAKSTSGNIVRNSLEVVFNLRRGISFDSLRRSASTREITRPSMDTKLRDEIPSSAYKKPLPSPVNFASLDTDPPLSESFPVEHHSPPLSAVPMVDLTTRVPVRNYQLHPSRNRFFFHGRIMTGGDSPWAFIVCFSIVLGITGVWFGTTCVWWWHNESPAVAIVGAYLALITITTMLRTATSDPGILPRDLDPDPPYPSTSPSDGAVRAPMPRVLKVRSDVVRTKYCPTCKTYRPPRASHCKMCDNCVDGCDHHCQWVNNCIGRRNYTSFVVLLLSGTITLILVIVTSALHLFFLTRLNHLNFRHALQQGAGSAVAFSLSISIIWPVAALLSYHLRLLLLNITTIEQIRNQAHKTLVPGPAPPNPFTHGSWKRNLFAILCRPAGYSWLNPSGIATEDKRQVNPGLMTNDEAWKTGGGNL